MALKKTGLLVLSGVLFLVGCGKKGPLLYPDMLIAQAPQQPLVEQSGAGLRVSFLLPDKDKAGRNLKDLEFVRISRRVCDKGTCQGCMAPYHELQRIDPSSPAPAERVGKRMSWTDRAVRLNEVMQYRLQTVQKGGVAGFPIDTLSIRVTKPIEVPKLTARSVFGGKIMLEVAGSAPDGTTLVGNRIYRAEGETLPQLLVALDAATISYEDQAVQRGITYRYEARTVVRRADGIIAESSGSPVISASVTDD
jgi:predicted small lipoprotein YifL